jgi:hypothetical protein
MSPVSIPYRCLKLVEKISIFSKYRLCIHTGT